MRRSDSFSMDANSFWYVSQGKTYFMFQIVNRCVCRARELVDAAPRMAQRGGARFEPVYGDQAKIVRISRGAVRHRDRWLSEMYDLGHCLAVAKPHLAGLEIHVSQCSPIFLGALASDQYDVAD